ncbi:Ig-like domain-containing protein [Pontibacter mangrovi]|uniref:T9SS type B sorting domain-containing protein n=1 Tax=Pontibacter mangrovi TaxID=2589816 RepID=A0A501WIM6_9BACT|nr:gliding motility-associated C-terminal domain-containing protein [Pontibacter mangrovi]TPE45466.1 T9SS type B sorting domain-containing protein [Pontibacter mangrovi]
MHLLLQRHLLLGFCVLFLLLANVAWAQCPTTVTVEGRTVLCQGETTTLRAPAGYEYQWIKDGQDLAGQTGETLQVSEAGTYQVRVSGAACATNTSSERVIAVNPSPTTPGFIITPTPLPNNPVCSGDQLTFSVNAPQPDVTYTWLFGDGATARGAEVTHTYTSLGVGDETFEVKAFATSALGCNSDTVTQDVVINKLPEVAFSEKAEFQVCLPDTVEDDEIEVFAEITNETVEPYLSDIRTYFVDWGNGEAEQQYSPGDFPISNPTAYDSVKTYPITIRAIAGNGCEVTFEQDFNVNKEPKANFSVEKKERVEEDQVPPCVPVIVTLADSATGGGLSYKWSVQPAQGWSFETGDSTSAEPSIRFTESGVYTIEQIVTNGCASDTTSQGIVVGWPQVQVPPSITTCGPTEIDYSSSGPGGMGSGLFVDKNLGENITVTISITGPTSVTRTFNSDTFQFKYNFTTPGKYTVAVEAVNECGSSNAIYQGQPAPVQEVVVLQQPAAPIVQAPGAACVGDTVRLTPSGPGPIYAWFDTNDPNATPLQTGASFTTPTLTGDVTYYVAAIDTANSVVCISPLTPIPISVVPAIDNNTIEVEAEQVLTLCKGDTPPVLTGSTPTGGDPDAAPRYRWEISTTSPTAGFAAAPGTNNTQNYTPTQPVSGNTWFRRIVYSGSCAENTSNVVAVVAVDPVPASANTVTAEATEICEGDTPPTLIGSEPSGGGGRPYTFLWEVSTQGATTGFASAPGTNNDVNYTLAPGQLSSGENWFRRAVTSGGCTSYSEPVKLTLYPALANNTISTEDANACIGTAPAILTGSEPTGGSGSYTYLWQSSTTGPDAGFGAATGTNAGQSYSPGNLGRTTWFRRIVRSAACGADTSAVLEISVSPAVRNNSITARQSEACMGQQPEEITGSTPTAGAGGYAYLWESSTIGPDAGFVQAAGTNTGQSYTPAALNRDTWFRRIVFSGGCSDTSNVAAVAVLPVPEPPTIAANNVTACLNGSATLAVATPGGMEYRWYTASTGGSPVFVGPEFVIDNVTETVTYYVETANDQECVSAARAPATVTVVVPEANAGEDVTIIQGQPVELRGSGGATYLWEPATGLNDPTLQSPIARPDETITYTLTITTAEGCVDTASVTVEVIPAIEVPNAFSPNGDNVNEVWEIKNYEDYPDMRVEVFNRWGNKIFSSKGYGVPWDGTYNGKELPVATYYYLIYLRSTNEEPISGNVTIIR